MPVPEKIKELVGKFDSNRGLYCGTGYNETRLRREFLDPFFEALGWDVDNTRGVSPVYQEVVHEYGTAVEGAQKTADYAFRIGERVKFFVEAKKPGVRLKEDAGPAYQLRKYAYSKQLPLSILTDFEEFAVYDGRVKPAEKDAAAKARVMYLTYEDYVERWDDIETVFGRDAIWKGAFDKFAEENKGGKHEPLDKTFLAMLERWRDVLARNVANRNRDLELDRYALTWAVQAILDRIIFLQVAEARGIEPDRNLQNAAEGPGVYERLVAIFREADDRYNSGLFHFREEKDRPGRRDELTPGLSLDDAVLRKIINELYDSPYEFGVVPVEILGHAYEQFLGKTIYVDGRGVHIDDKPEVRKAGGVYYTPQYIVEYIVENTVGELLKKCKAPKDVVKLRILDPACGSGSFLLGAYQRLLDWHLEWYFNDGPEKHTDKLIPVSGGTPLVGEEERRSWRLSIAEKKRILLNNIYGVDIDASAVEVTKLSLLLKALEGESAESVGAQEKLYKDRALPDLANNIKCGNSLVGWDYFNGQLKPDDEEVKRVNPFDWDKGFPDIMASGGFDTVIGNPPYFSLDIIDVNFKRYLQEKYRHFATKQSNIYFFFIAGGYYLLKENGLLSYINERYYMNSKNAMGFREYVSKNLRIKRIVDFKNIQVFDGVNTLTVINTFEKGKPHGTIDVIQYDNDARKINADSIIDSTNYKRFRYTQSELDSYNWIIVDDNTLNIRNKLLSLSEPLINFVDLGQGITSGLNDVFVVPEDLTNERGLESSALKRYVKTRDIKRYYIHYRSLYFILTLDENDINDMPNIRDYLSEHSARLRRRYECRKGQSKWYSVSVPRNLELFINSKEKILTPLYSKGNKFGYDPCDNDSDFYVLTDTYLLVMKQGQVSIKYILGILNSTLMDYYNIYFGKLKRDGYYEYSRNTLSRFPIRPIDFTDAADVEKHDAMVAMVDRMLDLHKRLADAKTPNKREAIQREIDATDARIDALVYELYGLTDEEIKIVEGS